MKSEDYQELSYEYANIITDKKILVLPCLIQSFAKVELYLLNGTAIVESQGRVIRHGKNCGTKVFLNQHYGVPDINPKFIWDGKQWLINSFGTFLFAEVEVNYPIKNEEKQ